MTKRQAIYMMMRCHANLQRSWSSPKPIEKSVLTRTGRRGWPEQMGDKIGADGSTNAFQHLPWHLGI